VARTTSDWQRWISPGVTFLLYESEEARGMVAGVRDESDPAIVHLMAMWGSSCDSWIGGARLNSWQRLSPGRNQRVQNACG